ncbi:hypothetical protein KCU65_g9879, partial [Aureobasidium melanogenum]
MDYGAGSGLNSLFKIGQTVYELVAVTEQAHDLLDSANHVSSSVETVRSLRRQKSGLLQAEEKRWIDRVINDTEKTLNNVASLVEPARVDMQTKFGKIGFANRALFVFRDSPKVATNLARLTLTSQSLNTALTMLSSREDAHIKATRVCQDSGSSSSEPIIQIQEATKPPPTYQESEYLNRKRLSRSNPSSISLRESFSPRIISVPPPIPLDSKPTAFRPVLPAFPELPVHQISEARTHGDSSDYNHKPDRRPPEMSYHEGSHTQVLSIPSRAVKTHIQEPESLNRTSLSWALSDLPYSYEESQDSTCYEMPDQNQYGYHAVSSSRLDISGWRDAASQFPTPPLRLLYPVLEPDFPASIPRTYLYQQVHNSPTGLPCEERRAKRLHVQSEISTCLQLDQKRETEPLDNNQSLEEPELERKLTARQTRKQWYADHAV